MAFLEGTNVNSWDGPQKYGIPAALLAMIFYKKKNIYNGYYELDRMIRNLIIIKKKYLRRVITFTVQNDNLLEMEPTNCSNKLDSCS